MKTLHAKMTAHLAETTTFLCTLWTITRTDGEVFRFTDHDADVEYQSETFKAATGFMRSAVESKVSFAADNLDVIGVLDNDALDEDDLRDGLFDHAEVQIDIVYWNNKADLNDYEIAAKIRRGHFGDFTISDNGVFQAELLGMIDLLNQRIVDVYQTECRADLGDPDTCKVPIKPDVIARNTAVALGYFYRVPTLSPTTPRKWENLLQNPSFEIDGAALYAGGDDHVPGWTHNVSWNVVPDGYQGLDSSDYSFHLMKVIGSDGTIWQDVDLLNAGLTAALIDADHGEIFYFRVKRANSDVDDEGQVVVTFLDEDKAEISTAYDSTQEEITPVDTWVVRSASNVPIPATTRYIRVAFSSFHVTGVLTDNCMDECILQVTLAGGFAYSGQALYENRYYEVTTAGTTAISQPAYDKTIGNTTTDGTAVLTCRNAWTRDAEIETVIDQKTFTIRLNEERADESDSWFKGGVFTFETGGSNVGRSFEIKEWTEDLDVGSENRIGTVELFRNLYTTIYPGQQVRLYPGCDHSLDACVDRYDNVTNFRGEPHIPGEDALIKTS